MADRYAQTSGNWSGSIWYDAPFGGSQVSKPVAGDTAYLLGGVTVTLDEDVQCTSIKASDGTNWTTGKLALSGSVTRQILADLYPGTDTLLTLSSFTGTLRIGGTLCGSNASSKYGIYITSAGCTVEPAPGYNFICQGSGSSAGGEALLLAAASSVSVTSAIGGSRNGRVAVLIASSGAVLNVGTATGGSAPWAYGLQCSTGTTTVGTAIGGSAMAAHCIYTNSSAANVTIGVAKGGSHANAGCVYPGIGGNIDILSIDPTGVGPIIGGGNIRLAPGLRLPLFDLDGNRREWISSAAARHGLVGVL